MIAQQARNSDFTAKTLYLEGQWRNVTIYAMFLALRVRWLPDILKYIEPNQQ